MEPIHFCVWGKPKTQGSKKVDAIYRKGADGRPVPVTDANGRVITRAREDNPLLESWRSAVAGAAMKVYDGEVLTGGITLQIEYRFARPKSHYGSGRNVRVLKPSAPEHHVQAPDVSKLTRAVEDALTGVLWQNDGQVWQERHRKVWVPMWEREGAIILVLPDDVGTLAERQQAAQGTLALVG